MFTLLYLTMGQAAADANKKTFRLRGTYKVYDKTSEVRSNFAIPPP